jgi:hypothetical protein
MRKIEIKRERERGNNKQKKFKRIERKSENKKA